MKIIKLALDNLNDCVDLIYISTSLEPSGLIRCPFLKLLRKLPIYIKLTSFTHMDGQTRRKQCKSNYTAEFLPDHSSKSVLQFDD